MPLMFKLCVVGGEAHPPSDGCDMWEMCREQVRSTNCLYDVLVCVFAHTSINMISELFKINFLSVCVMIILVVKNFERPLPHCNKKQ